MTTSAAHPILVVDDDPAILDLTANADPGRIAQVFANLLGNAAKFTTPGREITVDAARREHDVCIFVADNGEGIPREKLETIFERDS